MFTYYIHDRPTAFRFKLVGALAGAAAAELEQCRLTALSTMDGRVFVVDIDDLTGVDEAGRELLLRWQSHGAQFRAKSERARSLAESILGHALWDEEVVALTLTGRLRPELGGTPIVGESIVVVKGPRRPAPRAK